MKPVALLSVYDKTGIADFARELVGLGWEILASGGTAKALADAGVSVRDVATLVGGGEILGHRVVTLSREIHAGLLARDTKEDREELKKLGIPWIDLVCVDLYPLQDEIRSPKATRESVIEKTDIGGPTLLRSAAKGGRIVVCNSSDRAKVLGWLKQGQPDKENFLSDLAAKAEAVVANYCLESARYLGGGKYDGMIGETALACKYGENAWQTPAALYGVDTADPLSLDRFKLIAGTGPSYNNLCDVDRMLQTITHVAAVFDLNRGKAPCVALGVKHGNACGAAVGENAREVLEKMLSGSLRAIFGGLVMTNFPIDEALGETLLTYKVGEGRRLLDGIAAPSFTKGAVEMLKRSGDKCRFLANPALEKIGKNSLDTSPRLRYVRGGFLRQPNYTYVLDLNDSRLEKLGTISRELENDLLLAWGIGATSNSNTITLVKGGMLIGNGVGQQDRVGAAELAIRRAQIEGHDTQGAVAYGDSFFPFPDGPEVLANAGIKAILASSGSKGDDAVKALCRDRGVALYLIPDATGRGFFGH